MSVFIDALSAWFLPVALFVPLGLGALLLSCGRRLPVALARGVALAGFVAPPGVAGVMFFGFAGAMDAGTGYAFEVALPLGVEAWGMLLTLGVNGISLPLFALAAVVGAAAGVQAVCLCEVERAEVFWGLLLVMLGGMLGMFASVDVFFMYFFHEFALVPTFILMLVWGGVGRRTAAIQMAVFLTLGAMVALAGIVLVFLAAGGTSFNLLALRAALVPGGVGAQAGVIGGLLLFGFGALVSLFPMHSWAAPAYTEAPTAVSMLHAGVLKKFGLYGLVQLGVGVVPAGVVEWGGVLFWLAVGNVVVLGLVTMSQRHLKELIGWSSVMHMGLCFLGIAAFALGGGRDVSGVGAAVMLMFGHGLSVAALFALSHGVYARTGTLEFASLGGLAGRAPVLAGFFVAAMLAGMGLPGFANFWGELGVFVALGALPVWKLALAVCGIVISAIYGLRAVAWVCLGREPVALAERFARGGAGLSRDMVLGERFVAGLLLGVSLLVGFCPWLLGDMIHGALARLF
ncbi:MAG: NADH-quinone oxidoreductase subunit M [Puniceicoccales bacterium]|jgi:NADH-quinone oxidoreductase subunit M|nr:NADH-quinone oxidoreductase subunit M [Puniceicoccales bacterium]